MREGRRREKGRQKASRFLTRLSWALGHGFVSRCSRNADTTVELVLLCLGTSHLLLVFRLFW